MKFLEQVRDVGYEKPRVAVALLALSFFGIIYALLSLNAPPGWGAAFVALALCYIAAFVALAADCFWARWVASGLGWSGMMVGIAALITVGWHPTLAIYGGLHAIVVAMLLGPKMAARYEGQEQWRQRYAMDEFGVARLRKAVTRGSAALPSLIIWALGPREEGFALAAAATALAVGGLFALLRMRTWGLISLAAAAAAVFVAGGSLSVAALSTFFGTVEPVAAAATSTGISGALAVLLGAAALPFVPGAVRYFRSLR